MGSTERLMNTALHLSGFSAVRPLYDTTAFLSRSSIAELLPASVRPSWSFRQVLGSGVQGICGALDFIKMLGLPAMLAGFFGVSSCRQTFFDLLSPVEW